MSSSISSSTAPIAGKIVTASLWGLLVFIPVAGVLLTSSNVGSPGLSFVIGGLTTVVGAIVATFSMRYMRTDPARTSFFVFLAALIAAVLVFVFTGNALVFAAAWVASGLLLAHLIGHSGSWSEARRAAKRSRLTFLLGDAALLVALALLCWHGRSGQLGEAQAAISTLSPAMAAVVAMLILCAAAARSALPPFSGWLLTSMTAPTPVSALMHAGLVNAGGFLLLRFAPVMEAAPIIRMVAVGLGFFAAVWGLGIMAVRPDLKRSLAGSTISQMGFMVMSCGLGAYAAALWHIVAHGLFKAWLFLNAGSAIGMKTNRRPVLAGPAMVTGVAAVTLLGGSLLALTYPVSGELIPLLLAAATGLATLGAVVFDSATRKSRAILVSLLAGLGALNVFGFMIARRALGPDEGGPLSPLALILLLAAFLACWVWQTIRIAKSTPLPPALYVHLLNAGALRSALPGDRR